MWKSIANKRDTIVQLINIVYTEIIYIISLHIRDYWSHTTFCDKSISKLSIANRNGGEKKYKGRNFSSSRINCNVKKN